MKDQLLILLCHAAQHADHLIRASLLAELQPPQCRVNLVLSMFAHAACVEEDRVRLARIVRQRVALLAQRPDDEFTVQHVHLTADGLNEEFAVVRVGHRRRSDGLRQPVVAKRGCRLRRKCGGDQRGRGRGHDAGFGGDSSVTESVGRKSSCGDQSSNEASGTKLLAKLPTSKGAVRYFPRPPQTRVQGSGAGPSPF